MKLHRDFILGQCIGVSPDGVVSSSRQEVLGLPVDIETPDGTAVAVVSPEPLSIDGVPDIGLPVFGTREQEVTLSVVFDLSDGLFVTVQTDGLHGEVLTLKSKWRILLYSLIFSYSFYICFKSF